MTPIEKELRILRNRVVILGLQVWCGVLKVRIWLKDLKIRFINWLLK